MGAAPPAITDAVWQSAEDTDTGKRVTALMTTARDGDMLVCMTWDQWLIITADVIQHGHTAFPTGEGA